MKYPRIITLCGSTKYKEQYEEWNRVLTLQGNLVFSVGCFMHHDSVPITTEQKERLDELHKLKISLSDEIFIVSEDGYIGNSTVSEIQAAQALGITIRAGIRGYVADILPEKDCYFAEIKALPGCMTQGDTPKEVIDLIDDATHGWLQTAITRGIEYTAPLLEGCPA